MEKYKFKVGDRVRVVNIDDDDYYGQVVDFGKIEYSSRALHKREIIHENITRTETTS